MSTEEDNILPDVSAYSFNSEYGTKYDKGDIIHVSINCKPYKYNLKNKEVVLVIDLSSSMLPSLNNLKCSLLAFRDCLIGFTSEDIMNYSENVRDILLRNSIDITLIGFSESANVIWNNTSNITFENAVKNLKTQTLTNMGEGLKLAFQVLNPSIVSWIVVMTDGESNKGKHRTVNSFHKLVTQEKPFNSKIISLGYGKDFNPEVLNRIGTFSYIQDTEMISVVLGNIVDEIIYSKYFNCTVELEGLPGNEIEELSDDTIIIASDMDDVKGEIIIGDRFMGTLISGQIQHYVYLPHGNLEDKERLNKYNYVEISCTEISNMGHIIMNIPIVYLDNEHYDIDIIKEKYFENTKRRILYDLYETIQQGKSTSKIVRNIEKKLKHWVCFESIEHKEEIEHLLESFKKTAKHTDRKTLNIASGSGYTNTESGRASLALESARYYMDSPFI